MSKAMEDHKIYCVIDCRVSDPQQLKGGSLEDQEAASRMEAEQKGWVVDYVFRKPHSATTTERDDFEDVITYIIKRRKEGVRISKYICKTIDRFTRMGAIEYIALKTRLEDLGVDLVDTTGIIQPKRNSLEHLGDYKYWWSMSSPSEGGELLAAHESRQEVKKILTRLIGAEIKLVQDGYAVRRAPDGLKNREVVVDGKDKIIREADPKKAEFFKKMFYLLANGMDYPEVVQHLNATGFRTQVYRRWDRSDSEHPKIVGQKGGKPLTVKQLQRYVMQTEYAGISSEKWTKHHPVKMQQFDGIVSVDDFNRANRGKVFIKINEDQTIEVLYNYSPWGRLKRLKDNPKYPWKCITCPLCGSGMLASASTGKSGDRFGAYHCGGAKSGKRSHKFIRINQADFEENISLYLDSLKFADGFLDGLELHILDEYRSREKVILMDSSVISRTVSDLKAELAQKLDAFGLAKTQIMRDMLEDQANKLDAQIKQAENERGKIELTEKSIRAFRKHAEHLMEHPSKLLTEADNLRSRQQLMSLFFEETPTYEEILSGTPKLTCVFKLSEQFKVNKSQLVTLPGIEPGLPA